MKYTTINIQGNLISEEILQKIENAEAQGQKAADFGFEPGTNLRSEIEYAWSRIKLDWKHFSNKAENLPSNDPYGTTLSRRWMEQFLSSLGFALTQQKSGLQGDNNQSYTISHVASNPDGLPIHLVGFNEPGKPDKNTLDIKTSGGTSRFSPHATMQEYLNVTEHLFGMVANGLFIRLMRDSGRLIKLTYIEFDIKRMLDEDKYSEFTLLYRLLHSSRFPVNINETEQCLLEKYYQESIETGNRIRDGLSRAVKESLLALGKGFIQHENNTALREKIQAGNLTPKNYYRQLMRIIYRFLFLMVTEERDLIYDPEDKSEKTQRFKKIYWQFYSIHRLRKLSESRYVYEDQYNDLWQGLVKTFLLFEAEGNGLKLNIQPLGGELFSFNAIVDLQNSLINNKLLLECVRNMNEFTDEFKNLVPINYRSLDVEEFGSVYEGLLELHPVVDITSIHGGGQEGAFTFHEGTDRKTTGSFYTRQDLVNELIKSALIPVIEERLKNPKAFLTPQEIQKASTQKGGLAAAALLKLKVCDPASGSGHMVLAAARTIAWYLARALSDEDNPAPSVYRSCLREVIQHCIYAVDMNPDAVELCKLVLWLEGHNSGKPLSFLDHKIRCGNSLVGVTDLTLLQKGIPEEAYNPVTGDDKQVCQWFKKLAREENKTSYQTRLDFDAPAAEPAETKVFASEYRELESLPENSVEQTKEKATRFNKLRSDARWFKDWNACNIWTAAFFYNYTQADDPAAPTSAKLKTYLKTPTGIDGRVVGKAYSLSAEHKFFHWPLEFPDVFEQGGFDVKLGNPPWEIVELNAKEYFKNRDNEIAVANSDKSRKKLIDELLVTNPKLFYSYQDSKHDFDAQRKFIQESNRFPNGSKGRIDLYPLFVENSILLISKKGAIGLILPSDIATGAYNADLFSKIVIEKRLKCFYDFENSKAIFPSVHRSKRFCILALTGGDVNITKIDFFYFGHELSDLQNKQRRISLNYEELELFSPNTLAPPIFHTYKDYDISKRIYSKHGIFLNKRNLKNPWKASIKRMLSLSDNGVDFKKNIGLENSIKAKYFRMYSGKNIFQYNHRYAIYSNSETLEVGLNNLINPTFSIETEYYVPLDELNKRLGDKKPSNWLIGYRDVTNATNERTTISSILPRVACDTNCRNIFSELNSLMLSCLIGSLNSIPFDYLARQKIIGLHLNAGTLEQIPVLSPYIFTEEYISFVVPKILELSFSSWDIKAFVDDVWKEADEELKGAIKKQWEENRAVTGGHPWAPPEWCEDYGVAQEKVEGCPLPPFKWDEERRAHLKAELDAIYAKLYGLTTEELRYILDPQDVYGPDFPGETFRVLKEKEIRLYGEYRTRRLVLEAWERLDKED